MTAVEWLIRACPQCGSEAFRALPGAMAGDCGLNLKLLNPIRLPLDDNINAVLSSEAASG
jgi:hypothetical protein